RAENRMSGSGSSQSQDFLDRTSPEALCCGGDSHCASESARSDVEAAASPREACPPPLQWQQVVAAFREQSEQWHAKTSAGLITGRVWGEGPTLVFFNGLGGSCELFALCVYLLKAQCRCVLFDYPDGWTVSWRRLCDSVADVIEEFAGSGGCHLFGTSFGSALVLETAARLGPRIHSVTLHAAFAHLHLTVFERFASSLLRWMPGRIRSVPLWRSLQERSHRLWFPPIDPTRWRFYLDNAGATSIATLARRFGMLSQCDLRSRLSQLQTPVLSLQVEGEGAMQSRCRDELTAALPNVRSEFLHTTGMLAFLTHPHRLAKLIRELVAATLPPRGDIGAAVATANVAS
ncbi:MAG TPA: alpha/beta fold hydrolase, partial [Planctomycetaceae bacterium]|nr:alpha/beta fold hydrolase [Planctomycetaceae bacterium]